MLKRVNRSLSRFPYTLLVVVLGVQGFFLIAHEPELVGFDPANFVLAMKYGYSVDQLRPHTPGYPAFFLLWTAIRFVSGFPPHEVLLTTSLCFAILALILIHWATRRLFDEPTSELATILAASNLLFLYYGSVGEMYAYDAAFSAFMVILLLVASPRTEIWLYLVYGMLGSFRFSSVILTLPVVAVVLSIRAYRTRRLAPLIRDAGAFILGTLIWMIPFIIYLGGWDSFWRMLMDISIGYVTLTGNLSIFTGLTIWMIGAPGLLALVNAPKLARWPRDIRTVSLLLLIVIPAIFFAFRYVAKGYELIFLAPLVILFARALRSVKTYKIAFAVLGNLLLFFCMPYIAPSIRFVLNHGNRTASERLESALLRTTSVLAPTFAHISTSDKGIKNAKQLLVLLPLGSPVFVDPGAAFWVYPRSLQADYPEMTFFYPLGDDSMNVTSFSGAYTSDSNRWSSVEGLPVLYYLTDSALVNVIGKPPGSLIRGEGRLSLYEIPKDSIAALRDNLNRFFIRAN